MFAHMTDLLAAAEGAAASGGLDAALGKLRALSLDDFGVLLLQMPNPEYPALSAVLPRMSAEQVQRDWTGQAGFPLLAQSLNFVRSVALRFQQLTGTPLGEAPILDFGCGYGRLLRLMLHFSPPGQLWGVDPWDRSIEICRADKVPAHLAISDYLPRTLPVEETQRFRLIYAFSVFTHLSERATRMALGTLRRYVAEDGMLVITIRPREYWQVAASSGQSVDVPIDLTPRLREHDETGFTFIPHKRDAVEGDITYGDTSITFDWLARHAPGWAVAGYDHTLDDFYQLIVYLRPVAG